MCRNIKPLYNFEPPTTEDEIRAAAIQFVRKISGFQKPSENNKLAFALVFTCLVDFSNMAKSLIAKLGATRLGMS